MNSFSKMNKPTLDKWAVMLSIRADWNATVPFSKLLTIGLIKMTVPPQEAGFVPQPGKHYKGFCFCCRFWWPLEVLTWR